MKRQFRYQTGEIDKVIEEIKKSKFAQMDIDHEDEIEQVISDLADLNPVFSDYEQNYKVAEMIDEAEYHSRVTFADGTYVDFYLVDKQEETYDEIFWG